MDTTVDVRVPFIALNKMLSMIGVNREFIVDFENGDLYFKGRNGKDFLLNKRYYIKIIESYINEFAGGVDKDNYASIFLLDRTLRELEEWIKLMSEQDDDLEVDSIIEIINKFDGIKFDGKTIREILDTRVDKIPGKGLSTCNFSCAECEKLKKLDLKANKFSHPPSKICNYKEPVPSVNYKVGDVHLLAQDIDLGNIDPNANNYVHPKEKQCVYNVVTGINDVYGKEHVTIDKKFINAENIRDMWLLDKQNLKRNDYSLKKLIGYCSPNSVSNVFIEYIQNNYNCYYLGECTNTFTYGELFEALDLESSGIKEDNLAEYKDKQYKLYKFLKHGSILYVGAGAFLRNISYSMLEDAGIFNDDGSGKKFEFSPKSGRSRSAIIRGVRSTLSYDCESYEIINAKSYNGKKLDVDLFMKETTNTDLITSIGNKPYFLSNHYDNTKTEERCVFVSDHPFNPTRGGYSKRYVDDIYATDLDGRSLCFVPIIEILDYDSSIKANVEFRIKYPDKNYIPQNLTIEMVGGKEQNTITRTIKRGELINNKNEDYFSIIIDNNDVLIGDSYKYKIKDSSGEWYDVDASVTIETNPQIVEVNMLERYLNIYFTIIKNGETYYADELRAIFTFTINMRDGSKTIINDKNNDFYKMWLDCEKMGDNESRRFKIRIDGISSLNMDIDQQGLYIPSKSKNSYLNTINLWCNENPIERKNERNFLVGTDDPNRIYSAPEFANTKKHEDTVIINRENGLSYEINFNSKKIKYEAIIKRGKYDGLTAFVVPEKEDPSKYLYGFDISSLSSYINMHAGFHSFYYDKRGKMKDKVFDKTKHLALYKEVFELSPLDPVKILYPIIMNLDGYVINKFKIYFTNMNYKLNYNKIRVNMIYKSIDGSTKVSIGFGNISKIDPVDEYNNNLIIEGSTREMKETVDILLESVIEFLDDNDKVVDLTKSGVSGITKVGIESHTDKMKYSDGDYTFETVFNLSMEKATDGNPKNGGFKVYLLSMIKLTNPRGYSGLEDGIHLNKFPKYLSYSGITFEDSKIVRGDRYYDQEKVKIINTSKFSKSRGLSEVAHNERLLENIFFTLQSGDTGSSSSTARPNWLKGMSYADFKRYYVEQSNDELARMDGIPYRIAMYEFSMFPNPQLPFDYTKDVLYLTKPKYINNPSGQTGIPYVYSATEGNNTITMKSVVDDVLLPDGSISLRVRPAIGDFKFESDMIFYAYDEMNNGKAGIPDLPKDGKKYEIFLLSALKLSNPRGKSGFEDGYDRNEFPKYNRVRLHYDKLKIISTSNGYKSSDVNLSLTPFMRSGGCSLALFKDNERQLRDIYDRLSRSQSLIEGNSRIQTPGWFSGMSYRDFIRYFVDSEDDYLAKRDGIQYRIALYKLEVTMPFDFDFTRDQLYIDKPAFDYKARGGTLPYTKYLRSGEEITIKSVVDDVILPNGGISSRIRPNGSNDATLDDLIFMTYDEMYNEEEYDPYDPSPIDPPDDPEPPRRPDPPRPAPPRSNTEDWTIIFITKSSFRQNGRIVFPNHAVRIYPYLNGRQQVANTNLFSSLRERGRQITSTEYEARDIIRVEKDGDGLLNFFTEFSIEDRYRNKCKTMVHDTYDHYSKTITIMLTVS